MRITCEARASLAGISALPKAHLAHVLLPRCKDVKILNNNICPKENDAINYVGDSSLTLQICKESL